MSHVLHSIQMGRLTMWQGVQVGYIGRRLRRGRVANTDCMRLTRACALIRRLRYFIAKNGCVSIVLQNPRDRASCIDSCVQRVRPPRRRASRK